MFLPITHTTKNVPSNYTYNEECNNSLWTFVKSGKLVKVLRFILISFGNMILVYFQATIVVNMLVRGGMTRCIERHSRNSQWLQFLFLKFFHFMPCLLLYQLIINNYHAFPSFYSYTITILSSLNKFCYFIYIMYSYFVLVSFSFILICSLSDKNQLI